MNGMAPTKWTVFLKRQFVGGLPFILGGRIIPVLATFTGQGDDVTHIKNISIYEKYVADLCHRGDNPCKVTKNLAGLTQ
jgi:hypothetical protein